MKLMVLDGNSLVNRAFFGIKLLTTKDGRYTNAIYGFQNILLNLLAAHKPDAVAIAWDERAPTFRHNAYDGYKATRHGMPEELAQQLPAPPARTTASLPPETGTACSWWTMPRPFCWRPTRRPSPWTPPPSGRNTALSRPSSLM